MDVEGGRIKMAPGILKQFPLAEVFTWTECSDRAGMIVNLYAAFRERSGRHRVRGAEKVLLEDI
jgi:hypothetical protein